MLFQKGNNIYLWDYNNNKLSVLHNHLILDYKDRYIKKYWLRTYYYLYSYLLEFGYEKYDGY